MSESLRKELEILRVLSEHNEPIGSTLIRRELMRRGFFLSDRTVRYHLQLLEAKGLVKGFGKKGRSITPEGLSELSKSLAYQRIGFIVTKFLSMAYSVTYDLEVDYGKVVANVFMIDKTFRDKIFDVVHKLLENNLLTAPYIKVVDEGEEYGEISVPEGKVALLTVCNLTVDGILIHSGIPLFFKYGGLVQVLDGKPLRFVEMISYDGTTIPPLEVFVYRKMTSIRSVLDAGSGMVPASLREIPAQARDRTEAVLSKLREKGWGGVLAFGRPNEDLLGVPVGLDRFYLCMAGGLIPGAVLMEEGIHVDTFAPHCLIPVDDMRKVEEYV
ncbi:DUF128 domain-containing protein [Candidatus Bathyarchaeota archaeon]|nr:DUF128 domain-containing protein [Candidatus Bathyarchaeota archaeon]